MKPIYTPIDGSSWETLVKTYRKKLGSTAFKTLEEYALHFVDYIGKDVLAIIPSSHADQFVQEVCGSFIVYVRELINQEFFAEVNQGASACARKFRQIAHQTIIQEFERWETMPFAPGFGKASISDLRQRYNQLMSNVARDMMDSDSLFAKSQAKLTSLLLLVLTKDHPTPFQSGVVVAGFGEDESFPSLYSYNVDGIVLGRVRCKTDGNAKIDFGTRASIRAFAQSDVVETFMEGIDPEYREVESTWLLETVKKLPEMVMGKLSGLPDASGDLVKKALRSVLAQFIKDFGKTFDDYRRDKFWLPVVGVVTAMPKEELAALAEALVSLTALKRKLSDEMETVGGPIDVAVISKGDGLIWIKRKHYFAPELNQHFLANYFNRGYENDA